MAKSESTKIEFGYFHDYESEQFAFYRMLFRLDESSSIKKVNLSRKLPGKICWQAAWTQHLAMLQVL